MHSLVNATADRSLSRPYSIAYSPGMEISDRLDLLMRLRGIESQSALSRAAGVPQPTINRILKGATRSPDVATLESLATALSVDFRWLASGEGDGPDPTNSGPKKPLPAGKGNVEVWDHPDELEPDDGRIWIDRFDYHFSAGTGLIQWEVREKKALPFNAAFFKAKGVRPQDCKLLVVRGDSMEPWVEDKNVIMIDTADTRVRDGERYAIYFNDEPLVKQIFKEADGGLVLHSYNARYPDKLVQPDKLEFVHIVGRVIYRSG